MRHYALAKYEDADVYLCDVFLPCEGYVGGAFNTTDAEGIVTCVQCLTSRFKHACGVMNLAVINHLDEVSLLDHFIDHDALYAGYDPWR